MSNKDEGKLQSHTIELFAYDGIDDEINRM